MRDDIHIRKALLFVFCEKNGFHCGKIRLGIYRKLLNQIISLLSQIESVFLLSKKPNVSLQRSPLTAEKNREK